MGTRQLLEQTVHAALRVVDIAGSALDEAKGILLDLLVDDGDMDQTEEGESWGVAGLQARPRPGNETDGYAKAIRWRVGETTFVLATFDPREAVEVEEGETVLHALGKDGTLRSLVRLKPDGTVEIEGDAIKLGGAAASEGIGLGDTLQAFVDVFFAWTPVAQDGGQALKAALDLAFPSGATVASAKHDVEP